MRQRLRTRTSPLALLGRILTFLLACALVFYGAMLLLLALKVAPGTVDGISGYRTVYDELSGIAADDVSDVAKYVMAGVGLLAFLLFGYLALKEFPRPYLARHELELVDDPRGVVVIEPRAIERVAEATAEQHASVTDAAGRYGDDELAVAITVRTAKDTADVLRAVQKSVAESLGQHGLPVVPIHVTLTGFERRHQRELS